MSKTDELLKLAEAATPGPWQKINRAYKVHTVAGMDGLGIANADSPRTAAFIAAANPETIKRLVAVVEAAEEVNASNHYEGFEKLAKALEALK